MRIFFWVFILMATPSLANDYEDGVRDGTSSIETVKSQNLPAFMGSEMAESLNKPIDGAGSSIFTGKTASGVIAERQGAGHEITRSLAAEGEAVIRQGQALDTKSQAEFAGKKAENLDVADLANRTMVDAESMDNPLNPATQYAHDLQTGKAKFEISPEELVGKGFQQEYDEMVVAKTKEVATEKVCSQSLVGDVHERVMKLEVDAELRPAGSKTFTTAGAGSSVDLKPYLRDWATEPGLNLNLISYSFSYFGAGTVKSESGVGVPSQVVIPSVSNGFQATIMPIQFNFTPIRLSISPRMGFGSMMQTINLNCQSYNIQWQASIPAKSIFREEKWISDESSGAGWLEAGTFDELVAEDICRVVREECLEGPSTRTINGLSLTRPCWKKKLTYKCDIPQGENDCGSIPSNCIEAETQYVDFLDKHAVAVKKFRCLSTVTEYERQFVPRTVGLKNIDEHQRNNDIADAIVALAFVKSVLDDFRGKLAGIAGIFFHGQYYRCNKTKGCCVDRSSGWSKVFHCNGEERELAEKVRGKVCYKIGEFRSNKGVLRKVVKITKAGYCCYQSPIARIIQEGTHRQLGKSWGDPEGSACEGITVEELERLDFDKADFDFSDLFEELKTKALSATLDGSRVEALKRQIAEGLATDTSRKVEAGMGSLPGQQRQLELNRAEQEKIEKTLQDRKLSTFNPGTS